MNRKNIEVLKSVLSAHMDGDIQYSHYDKAYKEITGDDLPTITDDSRTGEKWIGLLADFLDVNPVTAQTYLLYPQEIIGPCAIIYTQYKIKHVFKALEVPEMYLFHGTYPKKILTKQIIFKNKASWQS